MNSAALLAGVLKNEEANRRRRVRRIERLDLFGQLRILLLADVSFHTGTLKEANHGQRAPSMLRPVEFKAVRLEWMIQGNTRRPRIGWRLWAYTALCHFHFDFMLRLAAA